jgi:copper(I)-binding protein
MNRVFASISLALLLAGWPTPASFAQNLPLQFVGGWVQAVPPTAGASAAYFRIVNPTGELFELVDARTPVAETVEPMITTRDSKGLAGMETVTALKIPAHGELVLQPGGNHLMLMSLRTHLEPGARVTLILTINPGRKEMQVSLPVLLQSPRENAK